MEIQTIWLKCKYRINKVLYYPVEIIKFFFEKKFTKIYFCSDHANWATDRTTNSVYEIARECGFHCKKSFNHPKNQYVFYGDQYSLLSKNIFKNNNIISFDYQHGLPQYSVVNKKLLKTIIDNQDKIKIIRVTNSFFREFLIEKGIVKEKILQIPLTVNKIFKKFSKNKSFDIKKSLGLPYDKFIIGSFHKDGDGWGAGMNPKVIKGPDIFLKTLKITKRKIKNLFVLLTGPARGYIKRGLEELAIDYMHFDSLNFQQLPNLYNCLDLYLISSRDEGGPTGMFEAMACGVPIVTTRVGLANDFITNKKNGFIVEVDDFKKLATCIVHVHNNKKLQRRFINTSIAIVSKQNSKHHRILWRNFFNILKNNS